MGYPEDALAPEEELLLHHHPHWKMLIGPTSIFLVATAVAGFLLGLAEARLEGTSATVLTVAVLVLWAVLVGRWCVARFVTWLTTHFIVTDRRVLVRKGVITHSGIDIPMGRISNVQFRHGLIDRMLRTGTLTIVSAADDPLEFDDIPDVQRVHALLYQQAFGGRDDDSGDRRAARRPGDEDTRRKAW
ncbi:PH domain-containing protein [Rhodococcus chondri]|uniref:PH domain-containing protein n=1 Tax=Rhodococcus chondri TaxID=3065941 RepID=A0ABU7JR17_9NOCA|nr:PH domain-containing protein [Rhodococcus sp. CC-R104]MEE2032460.1 PH domain-containing protein [Rhodococcus sp. CC-R104]